MIKMYNISGFYPPENTYHHTLEFSETSKDAVHSHMEKISLIHAGDVDFSSKYEIKIPQEIGYFTEIQQKLQIAIEALTKISKDIECYGNDCKYCEAGEDHPFTPASNIAVIALRKIKDDWRE